METVKQFGIELNSIQDTRPPVSRGKMGSITKLAMKANKYYKHIVMLVEKFISKSSAEYKVPGLYVIDSIMRQSRHQFGSKDSFGARFTRNFEKTFLHLFQCPEDDKPKIVRVLNLWQKNEVFPPDVIQPLLALASTDVIHSNPRHRDHKSVERHQDTSLLGLEQPPHLGDVGKAEDDPGDNQNLDLNTATTIIQQQQEQISALLQQQQQLQTQATSLLAPALSSVLVQQQQPISSGGVQQLEALSSLLQQTQQLQHLQAIQQRLTNGGDDRNVGGVPAQISNVETIAHEEQAPLFNEAVLDDFDYSDDEDSLDRASRLARQKEREKEREALNQPPLPHTLDNESGNPTHSSPVRRDNVEPLFPLKDVPPPFPQEPMPHPSLESHSYPRDIRGPGNPPPPPSSETFSPVPPPSSFPPPPHSLGPPPSQIPPGPPPHREWSRPHPPLPPHFPPPPRSPSPRMRRESRFSSPPPPMMGHSPSPPPLHRPPWRDRERERSRWGSPPHRRSRSPPMHLRRHSRDRSHSPPHSRWHRATTPPENQERRRKGIPLPRDNHMTVCSTTLWVGHLSKVATKDTVKEAFEDFGQVKSVELVQARGCAYLVMMHRNDAIRALNSLRDLKLGGSICKLAWAPGRGVKGSGLKAFWDQEVGSSYIPWSFIKSQSDVDSMGDGGWIDSATIPSGYKLPEPVREEESMDEDSEAAAPTVQMDIVQPQEPPQPPVTNILPPSLPPQQNMPPTPTLPVQPPVNITPPIPSFPQLMDPTTSFQPPREIIPQFPPRGPQLFSQPPFSRPNGPPFHGNIRPPLGGEPQAGMPQQIHPPPVIGSAPHSMAPRMGGVPQHNMPPIGAPQYSQVQMHMQQPQMMPNLLQHTHGVRMQSNPHQMMPRNVPPFGPHMGGAQPPLLSPVARVTHNFPQPVTQPPRPLMPSHMGDGHPMAPHMGEGPRHPLVPQVREEFRPPFAPHMGEGPRPPLAPHKQPRASFAPRVGEEFRPSFAANVGQQPSYLNRGMAEPPLAENQPPLPHSSSVRPPLPVSHELQFQSSGQSLPRVGTRPTGPPPVDNDTSPPVGEEPKELLPIPPAADEEPKELPPAMGEEPKEPPSTTDKAPKDQELAVPTPMEEPPPDGVPTGLSGVPVDETKEPLQPPVGEEPKELPLSVNEKPIPELPPMSEEPEGSLVAPASPRREPIDPPTNKHPMNEDLNESQHLMDDAPDKLAPMNEGAKDDSSHVYNEPSSPMNDKPKDSQLVSASTLSEAAVQDPEQASVQDNVQKGTTSGPKATPIAAELHQHAQLSFHNEPQKDKQQGPGMHHEKLHSVDRQPPVTNPQPHKGGDEPLDTAPRPQEVDEPLDILLSDDDMQIATTDEELEMKVTSPGDSDFL